MSSSCCYPLWMIILAITSTFVLIAGSAGVILLISLINPGVPACTCETFDNALLSWTKTTEIPGTSLIDVWLFFSGAGASSVDHSITTNASKFNILGPPIPASILGYTAVFVGPQIHLTGTASASFIYYSTDDTIPKNTIQYAVSWTNDNRVTWNRIAEGHIDVISTFTGNGALATMGSGTVTLPFSLILTPSTVGTGLIEIAMQRQLNTNAAQATIRYLTTSLSILVAEM